MWSFIRIWVASNKSGAAGLILTGGRIWTGSLKRPQADSIAVTGDTIVQVGASSNVLELRGPRTEVIDLRGRCVVPGFNDAHVHFSMGGASLQSVQLRNCRDEREFRDTLAAFAHAQPKGEWILHGEWEPERWPSGKLPAAATIDDATREHPVFVRRIDAHTALANSLAMRLAGVSKETPDVPGGVIDRYADGSPTGIFKDAAMALIERVIPPTLLPGMIAAVEAAQRYAARYGVTSVHDMGIVGGSPKECATLLQAYQVLLERDDLHVRVSLHTPLRAWQDLAGLGIRAGFGNSKLRIGALKGFSDGSLGSRTAWFTSPYSDAPHTNGMRGADLSNDDAMYAVLQQADQSGLQLAIHAIGDRANNVMLDLFDRLSAENGPRDRRARIEHAQHLLRSDFERFAGIGVVASVQPYHCIDDGCWLENSIGPKRAARSYAFRSLLDAGAVLALGSDWPIEPINPMLILYAAATRRTLDGKHPDGWMPQEKIALHEALNAYSRGSAYASFEEDVKGTLLTGKLADLAILSRDIFSIDPVELEGVEIDATVSGGKIVYQRI